MYTSLFIKEPRCHLLEEKVTAIFSRQLSEQIYPHNKKRSYLSRDHLFGGCILLFIYFWSSNAKKLPWINSLFGEGLSIKENI